MKGIAFLITLKLVVYVPLAKNVQGYVITNSNDTIKVTMKIASGAFSNDEPLKTDQRVKSVDSVGDIITTYDSSSIKEYGYTNHNEETKYRLKPIQDGGRYFLHVVVDGPKAALYSYVHFYGTASQGIEYFTFEKNDTAYLFLKSFDKLETLKKKIADFYSEFPAAQELAMKKFQNRWQIQKDVAAVVNSVNK